MKNFVTLASALHEQARGKKLHVIAQSVALPPLLLLVAVSGCTGPAKIQSTEHMKSNVGLSMDLSGAAEALQSELRLAGATPGVLLTLHAALEISTPQKTYYVNKVTNGQEIALDLPFGDLNVKALVLAEMRQPDWRDQCGKDRDSGSDSSKQSGSGQSGAGTSDPNQQQNQNNGPKLFNAVVNAKYQINESTDALAISFSELKEMAMMELPVFVDGKFPVGAKIVYTDAIAKQPIIDPCNGQPFFDEVKPGIIKGGFAKSTLPGLEFAGGRPFSMALQDPAKPNELKWIDFDPAILAMTVPLTSGGSNPPQNFAVLSWNGSDAKARIPADSEDTDRDGVSNGAEKAAKTNPFSAPLKPNVVVDVPSEGGRFSARVETDPNFWNTVSRMECQAIVDSSSLTPTQLATLESYKNMMMAWNPSAGPMGSLYLSGGPMPSPGLSYSPFPAGSFSPPPVTLSSPFPGASFSPQPVSLVNASPVGTLMPSGIPPTGGTQYASSPLGSFFPCQGNVSFNGVAGNAKVTFRLFDRFGFAAGQVEKSFAVGVPSAPQTPPPGSSSPPPGGSTPMPSGLSGNLPFEVSVTGLANGFMFASAPNQNFTLSASAAVPAGTNFMLYAKLSSNTSPGCSSLPLLASGPFSASTPVSVNLTGYPPASTFSFCVKFDGGFGSVVRVLNPVFTIMSPPQPGAPVQLSNITNTSVTLNWGAANAPGVPQDTLQYRLVRGAAPGDIDTVEEVAALSQADAVLINWQNNVTSFNLTGLTSDTNYFMALVVRNPAGQMAIYPPIRISNGGFPQLPGNGMTFGNVTSSSVDVFWLMASDAQTQQSDLRYKLVRATTAAAIDTVSEVTSLVGPSVVVDWAPNVSTANASGLSENTIYFFALAVRDLDGNTALYPVASQRTGSGPDTMAPVPNGSLSFSNFTLNSVTISVNAATDNVTPSNQLEYKIVRGFSPSEFGTPLELAQISDERMVRNWSPSLQNTIGGLLAGTNYWFAVVVKDAAQNVSMYPLNSATTTALPPNPVIGAPLSISNTTSSSVLLSWGSATDDATIKENLRYKVVRGSSALDVGDITYAANLADERVVLHWQTFVSNAAVLDHLVDSLNPSTSYWLNVLVKDDADNVSIYNPILVTTLAGPSVVSVSPASASYNAGPLNLTVTGVNFGSVQQVLVGTNICDNIANASATQFTCTISNAFSGYGPQNVTVFFSTGGEASGSNLFTVMGPTTLQINTPAETSLLHSFEENFEGSCNSAPGNVTTVKTDPVGVKGVKILNPTCVNNVLKFKVFFSAGSLPDLRFKLETRDSTNTMVSEDVAYYRFHKPCPEGYVGVAGLSGTVPGMFDFLSANDGLGSSLAGAGNTTAALDPTRDFCVMKYPAKASFKGVGAFDEPVFNGNQLFDVAQMKADSRAESTPFVQVTQSQAASACTSLGAGYGLISNTQWQVLARRLEHNPLNWSGGIVGIGKLNSGHTDNALPGSSRANGIAMTGSDMTLASSKNDAKFMFGTGNPYPLSGWHQLGNNPSMNDMQKRTHLLPDGSVVWDVSGNVAHWVREVRAELGVPKGIVDASATFYEYSSLTNVNLRKLFAPFGSILNTSNGAGNLIGGTSSGVLRGSDYSASYDAGIFRADLSYGQGAASLNRGFRCAFVPPEPLLYNASAPDVYGFQRYRNGSPLNDNLPVTIAGGGNWDLGWNISDNSSASSEIFVQVRRKVTNSATDFPNLQEPVYKEGFGLTRLLNETSWRWDPVQNRYEPAYGSFVTYSVIAFDTDGNQSAVDEYAVSVTDSCPAGYVGVAGFDGPANSWNDSGLTGLGHVYASAGNSDPGLDTARAFCVMKYNAKAQTGPGNPDGAFEPVATTDQALNFSQLLPDSRADGRPITNLDRNVAESECEELDLVYGGGSNPSGGFALMSNTQWQMIARSIENNPENWSTGVVGSGKLNRGHSDNVMDSAAAKMGASLNVDPSTKKVLASSVSDMNGYFGTGQSASTPWNSQGVSPPAGSEQLRTHVLPNGQLIWDMSGNIWQWVKGKNTTGFGTNGDIGVSTVLRAASGMLEFSDPSVGANDTLLFGGFGLYLSDQNAGSLEAGNGGAIVRGGGWGSGSFVGIFGTSLSLTATSLREDVGFRCVYMP